MNIEADINAICETRFNEVTGLVETMNNPKEGFKPMDDRQLKSILRELKNNGHKTSIQAVKNILYSDFSPRYNPFDDYFLNLPKWDKKDHIKQLTDLVDVENKKHWPDWFKKWLVAMVASAIDPETVNHQVLVLAGKQGVGKTTWVEYLIPKELKNYLYSGNIQPGNKDSLIHSSECIMINMDELATLGNNHIEGLKQIITQKTIRVRRPYGTTPENLPRRASFCGTTNEDQFLSDISGNRRFLCFSIQDIDLDKLKSVDINQLYAQVMELYCGDFKYWFEKKDIHAIEKNNEQYLRRTMEQDIIEEYFKPGSKVSFDHKWSATQVMEYLATEKKLYKSPSTAISVGRALTKLKYTKLKTGGAFKYYIKLKNRSKS